MFSVCKQVHAGNQPLQDRADYFQCGPDLVLVLADGAGGMGGGAEAAEFLVKSVRERIPSAETDESKLVALLTSIDQQMAEAGAFGETTGIVVVLSDHGLVGVSVGDSGAFVFSNHTSENLTQNQIRKPFIGSGRAIPVSFAREAVSGTVLVASDGLLKYTSLEKITAIAAGPDVDEAARNLVELVRYQSGALPDDVSVLLARSR
jgi:serine/threonine protein phosphatase PrpC